VGFVRLPILAPGRLRTILMHKEPFKLFLPAAHPLASRRELKLEHLNGAAFVTYSRRNAPGFAAALWKMMVDAGVRPSKSHEASDMYTLISLVSAGVGIAIAPASVMNYRLPDIVVRDLRDAPPSEIALLYRAGVDHPVASAFIRMAVGMYSGGSFEG
jgi:DNA-binding transcriptional LysR family regulator